MLIRLPALKYLEKPGAKSPSAPLLKNVTIQDSDTNRNAIFASGGWDCHSFSLDARPTEG